jgi:hypothetical protein
VTDAKKGKGAGGPPGTAGAVGRPAANKFLRTLVPQVVPPELQGLAPGREQTIEVSASDPDVMIETNPPTTKGELAGDARAVASQEPTDPGVVGRRLRLRKRIALAVAGGLGLVAIGIAGRVVVHRASANRSAPAAVPTAPVPAVSSPPPAPEAPSASEPAVATADSASPASDAQSPAASASAKTPAPKGHPARPKHAPARVTR